jgi:hypothetical protein
VNDAKNRFIVLQEDINSKLNECSICMETVEKLHREAEEVTGNLEEKLSNILKEENEWIDIKAKLKKLSKRGMVILNVGDNKYTTSVDTLTREKNTFFTALFSEQWELEIDNTDESIFIDRNGKLFFHILEYLRTDTVLKDVMKDDSLRRSLIIEAEYFRLHTLIDILTGAYFPNSTLLHPEYKMKLNEFYGKQGQRWRLIYKASRDGFDGNAFHTRCNNQGPTMTIIRSTNNYLFGGYTAVAWTSDGNYKNDTTAFLFTLTNPHNIPSTKYVINPGSTRNAVKHNNYGPCFGNSALSLTNNSHLNISNIDFPNAYIDTTGKGDATFTGANTFLTFDIEVFKLI